MKNSVFNPESGREYLNNNVIVTGSSGTGKTTNYAIPSIMEATGNYVIIDPKGVLYEKCSPCLKKKGYTITHLDLKDPQNSEPYNFLQCINNYDDIRKTAHILVSQPDIKSVKINKNGTVFSSDACCGDFTRLSELLLISVIGFLYGFCNWDELLMKNVFKVLETIHPVDYGSKCAADYLMDRMAEYSPDADAPKIYRRIRQAAPETLQSIMIDLYSRIAYLDTPAVSRIINNHSHKTESFSLIRNAVFLTLSDSDRSLDPLASLYLTNTLRELFERSDKDLGGYPLPFPVRFIFDDFANCGRIDEIPRIISSVRSRGISMMFLVQSESQLYEQYGVSARTIIGNCDTYVYLGGNDVQTTESVAERCSVSLNEMLSLPPGKAWICRRGSEPENIMI